MSRRSSLIFLALLIPAALVSQTIPKNMAVGTWKLNTAKSKYEPGPVPASATVIFGEDNKIQFSEETADGKSTSWSVLPTSGGTPAAIVGIENSTLVEKRIDGRHAEETWKMGSGTLIGKSVISKNGRTMTYTLRGTNSEGKPVAMPLVERGADNDRMEGWKATMSVGLCHRSKRRCILIQQPMCRR